MPPKKPKFAYSHEQLLEALEAVKKGENVNAASKRYGIPQSTLAYKVAGKTPLERRQGPEPRLGLKCEEMLVNWVLAMAVKGFPITKEDLITSATQIAKDQNPQAKDLQLGKKWLKLFLNRYPKIAERKPEKLSKIRASVSEATVRNWFNEVKTTLNGMKVGLSDVLNDPSRLFNLDETAFFLCPKSGKVLGLKGQKNVYEVHGGSDKENLTVLCTVSANGAVAPTLIVFPGQRLPAGNKLNVPEDWAISRSESGWINGEIFFEFIINTFYVWLTEQKVQFPVIIFMDGHNSHLTYHLSVFCAKYNIILIALPPNCTHAIQPLDVAVFKPVKQEWASTVHKWRMAHYDENLTKFNFAPLLKEVLDQTMKPDTIINGFKRCGLSPFDADAVDYSKIDVHNNAVPQPKKATGVNPSPPQTSRQECLMFLENFISNELLAQFGETYRKFTPVWDGAESAHDLYVVWKKAKDFVSGPSAEVTTTKSMSTTSIEEPIMTSNSEMTSNNPKTTSSIEEPIMPSSSTSLASKCSVLEPSVTSTDVVIEPVASTSSAVAEPTVPLDSADGSIIESPGNRQQLAKENSLAKVLSPGTDGEGVPTPLKRHLFWPGTPTKTKKKRNNKNEKMPAVITSKKWQEIEKKKRDEKIKIELEKEQRKRLREEKKKSKDDSKRIKKKIVFDEDDDWKCEKCKRRFSAEQSMGIKSRWIECDKCKKTYHYRCIPKKHLDTFGVEESDEDDDELNFLCHLCVSDVESDCEPFKLSDTDSEEELV